MPASSNHALKGINDKGFKTSHCIIWFKTIVVHERDEFLLVGSLSLPTPDTFRTILEADVG